MPQRYREVGNGLSEYFLSIISVAVSIGLISQLLPTNEESGIKRALDLFLSLCLICAVISPIQSIVSIVRDEIENGTLGFEIPELDSDSENAVFDSLAEITRADIEKKLEEILCEALELPSECIVIRAETIANPDGVRIVGVTVCLYGRGMWADPRVIIETMGKYTDGECIIVNGR